MGKQLFIIEAGGNGTVLKETSEVMDWFEDGRRGLENV